MLINGYTHNSTLTSGGSVLLGSEVEEYYGRKVYNEHILAANTTSTSDRGTYTCQVTATGQEATENFTIRVTGTYAL